MDGWKSIINGLDVGVESYSLDGIDSMRFFMMESNFVRMDNNGSWMELMELSLLWMDGWMDG